MFQHSTVFCLRHTLKSFDRSKYSYETSELVRCKSNSRLTNMIQLISKQFQQQYKSNNDLIEINNNLKKVVLIFANFEIRVLNENKWKSVAMVFRQENTIATTSNCLESTHR
jgi:hypothetical protein